MKKEKKKAVSPAPPAPLKGTTKPLVETVSEKLRCQLAEKERLVLLEDQNATMQQMTGIKEEAKKVAGEFREKLKERAGHISTIADQLEHGVVKSVKVKKTYDFSANKVTTERLDSNEKTEAVMTQFERAKAQGRLPLEAARDKAAEAVEAGKPKAEAKTEEKPKPKDKEDEFK